MKLIAVYHWKRANRFHDKGDIDGAIRHYEAAIRHAPEWDSPWYNLGLVHKYASQWRESLRCNAEAVRLNPSKEAAVWNLGIAATALGDWKEARRAWRLYGINVPDGDGPIEGDYGSVPIRINPNGDGEVVWAKRIDPARAIVESVPLPESGHRNGDLLLHDGAPVGHRILNGKEVPVFNELEILFRSPKGTFEVTIRTGTIEDLVDFEKSCEAEGCGAEDWSTMRIICRKCGEGTPHEHAEPRIEGEHRFAVASTTRFAVQRAVQGWLAGDASRVAGEISLRTSLVRLTGGRIADIAAE